MNDPLTQDEALTILKRARSHIWDASREISEADVASNLAYKQMRNAIERLEDAVMLYERAPANPPMESTS